MIRLLMIVSGAFEAAFGASALLTPNMVVDALGTGSGLSAVFVARSSARRLRRLASPPCSPAMRLRLPAASPWPMV